MANKNEKEVIHGVVGAYARSPDGNLWRVKVSNTGSTSTEQVK